MKKIISLAMATALVLSMSAVAFAAGSVNGSITEDKVVADGGVVVVTPEVDVEANKETGALIDSISNPEKAAVVVEKAGLSLDPTTQSITILAAVELDITPAVAGEAVTVTVAIDGVKKGDTVIAIHEKADGTLESIYCTVVDGKVTFSATSGSPFTFVKVANKYTGTTGSTADAGTTTVAPAAGVTSPATGEANVVVVMMGAMMVVGVAAFAIVRKQEN